MSDHQRNEACILTASQTASVDYARHDLENARDTDLACLTQASLILLVETLRGRLDDVLQVVDEISRN